MFTYIAMVLELYHYQQQKASVYGIYYCYVVATHDLRVERFLTETSYSDNIS